jgi:aminopeptidase N
VAARLLTAFRIWRSFEPGRRGQAEAALSALRDGPELSRNTADILERILAG